MGQGEGGTSGGDGARGFYRRAPLAETAPAPHQAQEQAVEAVRAEDVDWRRGLPAVPPIRPLARDTEEGTGPPRQEVFGVRNHKEAASTPPFLRTSRSFLTIRDQGHPGSCEGGIGCWR